ncbi:hypothetical protein BCR36DRAFT_412562 [Piromyces finnis]|uniref:COPI associated n=1 Tax=Piromyces finnis TaxID=1754191 RepID=A0A1Y1V8X1_9FUNG|nr:hypothetical protein BCR36DRAFT_412562 [Piromyces finnis]|eukprot:ORX50074.1 hypothetical protein BCR36DRAFT_412562 [Piromyces finnis]
MENLKLMYYFSLISLALLAIGGIMYILTNPFAFNSIVIGGVTSFLSCVLCLIQLANENSIPQAMKKYCPFLFTYIGRGVVLIFFGCIILTSNVPLLVIASISVFVGIIFIVFHYISNDHYNEEKEIFGWAPNFSDMIV